MTPSAARSLPNEYDPKVPGLFLRHGARGAVWYLFYRTRDGVKRTPKLGSAKVMNRTQAREMAARILLEAAQGKDPKREARAQQRYTLADLWAEYDRLHMQIEIKPSSRAAYEIYWRKHIIPNLGATTPVRSVTRTDIVRLKGALAQWPPTANRVIKMLSHAFSLAEDWQWRDERSNPCYRIKYYREAGRIRVPSAQEAQRLLQTIKAWEIREPWFVGMILLLCLTGARRGEIMKSRREWWQGDQLVLPDSKTGAKIIPLNTHARSVAASIPEVKGNPYLIVGRRAGAHLASPKGLWARLCQEAGIENLNMHDLRRFFASVAVSSGQSLEQAMQLMGHTQAQTTKGYAFLMTPEKLAAMQATGDQVMRITQKNAPD